MGDTKRELKAVLVGCGGISHAWMKPAKNVPGLTVAGYVDINPAAAKKLAAEYGPEGALTGSNLAEMLDRIRPDMVFNCTVPEAHAEVTVVALRAGCHVLEEKPLADTIDNARLMVVEAKKAGKLFAVIQNRRYDKRIRRLRRFLVSGVLGRIGTVHCDFIIGAHFGGFRDSMAHVLLLDMAIHTFDAARFLMGSDPKSVICREFNPAGSWYDRDASAIATFDMADSCVYAYRGSWCAEGLNSTWECDWRFIGENGSLKWNGGDEFKAQVVAERGGFHSKWKDIEVPPAQPDDKDGGHFGLISEFVSCVRNGGNPETTGEDNIKSLAMVLSAIESAGKGSVVDIKW
jgi:predicted dehydrogenase